MPANGTAGYDVLETYFPVTFPFGQYRLGFVYTDPNAGSDAVITANGQPGGASILFALGPFPVIPTLAHGTLLLLAFALAWLALRRLRQLEHENTRLKRLVADLTLDNQALKDLVGKKA